jgi:hypothetical protein
MLIRINQNSEGIEHYFETGIKTGRNKTRDELDKRVPLSGDLESFSRVAQFTRDNKRWKNHYWHLSGSFALANQNLSDDDIRKIHQEMLEYYFCRYVPKKKHKEDGEDIIDRIIHASEIHRPKIQTGITGMDQRLAHFHMAVSKLDQETGNQLRMIPYRNNADKAFQSYLALKYKLEDPALNRRPFGKPIFENIIILQTGKHYVNGLSKMTLPEYKKIVIQLLEGATSLEEVKEILEDKEDITRVDFKEYQQKEKDPETGIFTGRKISVHKYFQINSTHFPKMNVNLRGRGFEKLEKLIYTLEELEKKIVQDKKKPSKTPKHWKSYTDQEREVAIEEQRKIFREHQHWWIKQGIKEELELKNPKRRNLKALEKRCVAKYEKRIKEQGRYFVIYRFNIDADQIKGYRIWEKNNIRYLYNNDMGVKIYDHPEKIVLRIPNDPKKLRDAVVLSLKLARDKGWHLRMIKLTGSPELIAESKRQIEKILKSEKTIPVKPPVKPKPKKRPYLNDLDYIEKENADKKAGKKVSKERINTIKTELDPQAVINLAEKKWALPVSKYEVMVRKIKHKETHRTWDVVDFLTKVCNQPIFETYEWLDDLLKAQEEVFDKARGQHDAEILRETEAEKIIDDIDIDSSEREEFYEDDFDLDRPFADLEDDYGPRM